ncbi:MAG TPA: hypothetical protein VFV73_43795 [Streptosporangiaceae bacterium]|nr:hypothetical protein [Streptosporangiaceae bacterium]
MPVALRPAGRDPGLAVVDVDGVPMSARAGAALGFTVIALGRPGYGGGEVRR